MDTRVRALFLMVRMSLTLQHTSIATASSRTVSDDYAVHPGTSLEPRLPPVSDHISEVSLRTRSSNFNLYHDSCSTLALMTRCLHNGIRMGSGYELLSNLIEMRMRGGTNTRNCCLGYCVLLCASSSAAIPTVLLKFLIPSAMPLSIRTLFIASAVLRLASDLTPLVFLLRCS